MYLPSLPSALSRTKHILKIKENTKSFQKQTKESQTDYLVYPTCFKLQEKSLTSFSCSKKCKPYSGTFIYFTTMQDKE